MKNKSQRELELHAAAGRVGGLSAHRFICRRLLLERFPRVPQGSRGSVRPPGLPARLPDSQQVQDPSAEVKHWSVDRREEEGILGEPGIVRG